MQPRLIDSVRSWAPALAIALPVFSLVAAMTRAELHRAEAEDWTFVARGYDPRDLLRGHYVQFRIDFGEPTAGFACLDSDPDCCLCLSKTPDSKVPRTRRMSCAAAAVQCDGMLQTSFLGRLDRYYVPEDRAHELDQKVRQAGNDHRLHVVVGIGPTGRGEVKALLIGEQRFE